MDFKEYPKTPRLNREIIVTEKIDGTNACIVVSDDHEMLAEYPVGEPVFPEYGIAVGNGRQVVRAQSRSRFIHPGQDNFGFAKWVWGNAVELANLLGPGYHYGEWFGSGIQRGYGLKKGEKRFSLFAIDRYSEVDLSSVLGLGLVPELYRGPFDSEVIAKIVQHLADNGSAAVPSFSNPEGVIVYHTAARQVFKVTCKDDQTPKELVKQDR